MKSTSISSRKGVKYLDMMELRNTPKITDNMTAPPGKGKNELLNDTTFASTEEAITIITIL